VQRYRARLSGPLLDRIDLIIEVPRIPLAQLTGQPAPADSESSREIRQRVKLARDRQLRRYNRPNALMNSGETERHCRLNEPQQQRPLQVAGKFGLSARGYQRILRVARTIADLANRQQIGDEQLLEAVSYRKLDRSFRQT
jgi:magnesium chelatase family protein